MHAPIFGSSLGPVPPTPAGWVDEEYARSAAAAAASHPPSLYTNTADVPHGPVAVTLSDEGAATSSGILSSPPVTSNKSSTYGLVRSAAVRDPSAKGIRERRSESRSGKQKETRELEPQSAVSSTSNNPWEEALHAVKPADLDLTKARHGSTERSAATPGPSSARKRPGDLGSGRPTPRLDTGRLSSFEDRITDTPPFSPAVGACPPAASRSRSPVVPPKALPTPPPQQYSRPPSSSSLYAPSSASDRPISHIFHLPNDNVAIPAPLTPRRTAIKAADAEARKRRGDELFSTDASERFNQFLKRENEAESDSERLKLFADFIIFESSLRRGRYSEAWDQGVVDLESIRENIFAKPRAIPRRGSGLRPIVSTSGDTSKRTDPQWWTGYQPMLSPIAASMSNGPDEMDSRGRAPSRWWESQTGSSEGGSRRLEQRSKRETKYMGLPREAREAMQYEMEAIQHDLDNPLDGVNYGADEYPVEKVGLHEQSVSFPGADYDMGLADTPKFGDTNPLATPASKKLDISRLVTLPPPYPRHYPAVQNNHPDLVSYRKHVRAVTNLDELKGRKQKYYDSTVAVNEVAKGEISARKRGFRSNLSDRISQGDVSFAEAAEAEAAFNISIQDEEKKRLQADFESFQNQVLNPLQDLLNDRITSTTTLIGQLEAMISAESELRNPNQTAAEEGDERPETLESLTVLKWLFEAREMLHREMFTVECERSQKYKELVTLPYRQNKNTTKLRDTNAFFTQDEQNQRIKSEEGTAARWQAFLQFIEKHVDDGVQVQLSAFWDIAPNLVSLLQKIPEEDLSELPENSKAASTAEGWYGVQIPSSEQSENPSYEQHPMQYLYSLLDHAEKSTYQFIEAQINLLCLLHEVRCGSVAAHSKLKEAQHLTPFVLATNGDQGMDDPSQQAMKQEQERVQKEKDREEAALTADLKERVGDIESLHREALGSKIESVKDAVKDWLIQTGGWEGMEEE
ncbi:hypothetical protein UCRPC4_g05586 [Phaeomoniella chlamydospora]|uniref:Uncharacterized protein n=1 Tax=Phaeomoniella chlamydospora TaxID=158046 RepID=A0A0G2E3Z9_PHACM|nr:hypothetical protein UCRPC4_g05586 [Phaeomoniella chlamydospora]